MAKDQTPKPQTKPASRSPLPTTEAAAPVMEQLLSPATLAGQLANGGDTGLKQAALLQMQRQHGNQFVQRYLANRNGPNGGRTNEPAGPTELPFEEQFNDESGDGPRAFAPPEPPPIQRAEDPPSDAPSDAEKEQALANARAAEAQAGQEKGVAQQEVAVSQEQAEVKKGEKEQAQQKKAAAKNGAGPVGKNGKPTLTGAPAKAKGAGLNGAGPGTAGSPTPATDHAPATSDEDPAFQNVISSAQSVAQQEQTHEPAEQKASQAQAAAQMPPEETAAHAEANQAGEMEAAETPAFDAAAFKAKLMARVEAMSPRTAQEADQFKGSGKLDAVQSELQGEAAQQQEASQAPLEQAKDAPPDTGAVPEKPVTPLEPAQPGEVTTEINAAQAAPKPKTSGEIEGPIQEGAQSLDEQMAEAEVTEEQLANSNEPSFNEALASKQEAKESAASSPPEYRQTEQAQLQTAQMAAENEAATQLQGMHDSRVGLFDQVAGQQNETVSADEQKRAEIAAQINSIYEETKTRVDGILSTLDEEVASTFSAGAEAAKSAFENFVDAKMEAYKEERYGGMFGWAKWAKDKLLGMPSEVNAFYSEGRTLFLQKMDAVLDNIVQLISAALTEAKAAVAEGRQQINEYVAGLPQDLQEIGAEAAQEVQGRFDELEQQIDDKQGELIESLARQYTEQVQALDARIEELKAANQGLVQQAFNKIAGVIRTINELKDMLLNVLARAASVIKAILADPIGFLSNLINGIKAGLNQFISNIGEHLQKGFIGWLTGSLADAGIELPETFDMAGIFSLVMQVLGISFEKIIGRVSEVLGIDIMSIWDKIQQVIEIYQTEGLPGLAKYGLEQVIGEENVAALIQVVNIIKMAMEGNLAALWDLVQTHLTGLKELIFDQIQDFLITKVIKAGIMWIISMLNPAGAFIRACKAIYDIVMFFIERGSQIMSLVEAIIGAVSSIVSGNISAMAQAVENALARAIPVAISFLASLLGLGGISDKVREVIEKVRGLVDRALDAVFNSRPVQAVAGFIRTIIAKMGQLVERGKEAVANAFGGGSSADDDEPAAAGPGAAPASNAPAGSAGDAADSEQSLDVKEKARQRVAERTKQPFQKREELDQVINEIRQELAPEGLKALQLDPKEGQPGKFDVIATASPPTDVGDATVDTSGKYPTGEDPTTRTITQLWKDCSADTTLAGESPADKVERVRLAEATLTAKLGNSAAIQAILAHERGQKPRPFVSVSAEDAHPAAHTTERHVFGMGIVTDVSKLAMRVARHTPAACPGKAGAFESLGDADVSVQKAIKNNVVDNWEDVRQTVAAGSGTLHLRASLSGRGTALIKTDPPANQKYQAVALPRAHHALGTGVRPLYPGDTEITAHVAEADVDRANPMTQYEAPSEVYVRFVVDPSAPGGWYVNSAWPE